MTIENDRTGTFSGTDGGSGGRSSPMTGDTMEASKTEARNVAATAKEGGKDVVGEVTEKTAEVASTAKGEIQRLMDQASTEVRNVGRERGEQLAGRLDTLVQQMRALREGRVEEAGDLRSWMSQAEQRMQHYASTLRDRGPDGVLEDVRRFARRRPGAFLLAAGATGFAVGRAVRAGAMSSHNSEPQGMTGYGSNGLYSQYGAGNGSDELGLPVEMEYRSTTIILEPDDTLPPPTMGMQEERQIP